VAAGNTYVAIATQTLGSTTSSVTFSSIPSTYTDLVLVIIGEAYFGSTNYINTGVQFNGDTASNYSTTRMYGDGTTATSNRYSNESNIRAGWMHAEPTVNSITSTLIYQINNYSNATTYKTLLSRNNAPGDAVGANVGLWRSTSAITSILIKNNDSATGFFTGSTFSLYGILAA
jgi:hypothetical protein